VSGLVLVKRNDYIKRLITRLREETRTCLGWLFGTGETTVPADASHELYTGTVHTRTAIMKRFLTSVCH